MKFRSAALVMTAVFGFAAPAAAQNANADWGAPPSAPSNGPQWGPPPGAAPQQQAPAVRNVTPGRESAPAAAPAQAAPAPAAAAPARPAPQAMAPAPAASPGWGAPPAPAAPAGWGPPPAQAAGPQWGPPGGASGGMQSGNQVLQQEPPCMKDITPLRAAVERDGNVVKKAIESKADRAVVCSGLTKFAATEAKFVGYLDKNQQFCGVPADVVGQLKKNHSHTVKLRGQACATGPAQAGRPQGTGLSEALGTSRGPAPVINRGGAFGTLTGSAIAR